jgi:hypothetical protein
MLIQGYDAHVSKVKMVNRNSSGHAQLSPKSFKTGKGTLKVHNSS